MAKIVYICGPITGKLLGNFKRFNQAASYYRNRGFEVINHYEISADWAQGTSEHDIMRSELAAITVHVDFIALLPEWEESRGALVEVATGIISGIPFVKAFSFNRIYPKLIIHAYGCQTSKELVAQDFDATKSADSDEQMSSKQSVGVVSPRATGKTVIRVPLCGG